VSVRAKILFGLLVIALGTGCYFWGRFDGWKKTTMESSLISSLAQGQSGVLKARALRKAQTGEALRWIESEIKSNQMFLYSVQKGIPARWRVAYDRVSKMMEDYQRDYKTLYTSKELEKIPV
jgi:hypothetical protein